MNFPRLLLGAVFPPLAMVFLLARCISGATALCGPDAGCGLSTPIPLDAASDARDASSDADTGAGTGDGSSPADSGAADSNGNG